MAERHKWADVIMAMLAGDSIEYENERNKEWKEPTDKSVNPISQSHWNWRIKPRTIMIGDMEVPEPIKEPPELETVLYVPRTDDDYFFYEFFFRGLAHQYNRIDMGMCHLSEEAAITHAKALIKISGGNV